MTWTINEKVKIIVGMEEIEVAKEELTVEKVKEIAKEKGIRKFDVDAKLEDGSIVSVTPANFDEFKTRIVELKIIPRDRAGY